MVNKEDLERLSRIRNAIQGTFCLLTHDDTGDEVRHIFREIIEDLDGLASPYRYDIYGGNYLTEEAWERNYG